MTATFYTTQPVFLTRKIILPRCPHCGEIYQTLFGFEIYEAVCVNGHTKLRPDYRDLGEGTQETRSSVLGL